MYVGALMESWAMESIGEIPSGCCLAQLILSPPYNHSQTRPVGGGGYSFVCAVT